MTVDKAMYKIIFLSEDIRGFKEVFSTLLREMFSENFKEEIPEEEKNLDKFPDFKVVCTKQRIALYLPKCPKSFLFLAEIVKKIDGFKVQYDASDVSQESIYENDAPTEIMKDDDKMASEHIVTEEAVPVEKKEFTKFDERMARNSKVSRTMKYILTCKGLFTSKNIEEQCPEADHMSVYHAISYLIEAGKIKHIGGAKPRFYAVEQDE